MPGETSGRRPKRGQWFRHVPAAPAPHPKPPDEEGQAPSPDEIGAYPVWRGRAARLANIWLGATFTFGPRVSRVLRVLEKSALSLVGLAFTVPLLAPAAEVHLSDFKQTTEFSIAVGALIGTVLVLTFTLSMIPVQRAAEGMPVSVVRLLARDSVNAFLFLVLAFVCLLSFSLGLYKGLWLRAQTALPLQLLLIGVTFDLVRWHYRHTLGLLEPIRAVNSLLAQALAAINSIDRRVRRAAFVQWWLFPRQTRREVGVRDKLIAAIYRTVPNHAALINQWTQELQEAALRSVEQVETRVASAAIDAITLMARRYLDCRRHTLTPILVNMLGVYDSDLRGVLTPVYESLMRIGLGAIAAKNEPVVIRVIQGLQEVALTCVTLQSRAFREGRAPLAAMPLAYLEKCALAAVAEGLHDAGLEAARSLASVSVAAPANTDLADVHTPTADSIVKIVASLLTRNQSALANMCVEDALQSLWSVVMSRHFRAKFYFGHVVRELSSLFPLAIVLDAANGRNLMTTPLAPMYDLSRNVALAHLVAAIAAPDTHEERDRYHYLAELSAEFHQHLYSVAERSGLNDSSLVWHIVKTIGFIAEVYASVLSDADSDDLRAEAEKLVTKELPWFLAFHWVHFSKASAIDLQTANEATDSLATVAFTYIKLGIQKVVESAVNNIGSVTEAYAKLGKFRSPYDIGDLLRPLLCVERFAVATGQQELLYQIDREVDEIMKVFDGDQKTAVGEAVDVRRSQIDDDLDDRWLTLIERDSPEGLLAQMLSERGLLR